MTDTNPAPTKSWTVKQAIIVAVVCLTVGIAGGWSIRAAQSPAAVAGANGANGSATATNAAKPASQMPGPLQLKEMADAQAAPLLDKLRSKPDNPDLLTSIGDLYYDAKQYPTAVGYYERVLKGKPSDAAVRTDMATAYWYMGNADTAIIEFNRALAYAPTSPNTLFNLGLVQWQGKKDGDAALADWEKLLAANPNYEEKDKVRQMMAEVKAHTPAKP